MKSTIRILWTVWMVGLAILAASPAGWSQTTGGTILGVVKDASGAVIPGAAVTIKNTDTGLTRTAISNETGSYMARNLPLGSYQVSVEMAGFKSFVQSGIVLTVGREAVVDALLQIGEVSERVEVTGEASLVNTQSATMEELVDQKKIRDLPLNGRDYMQLASLQPGVITMPQQLGSSYVASGAGLNMSIGGGRPVQNNFRMDGVSINDHTNAGPGSTSGTNMGVEALREFSVMTNTYSAEFGRSAGGVINAVTRSGTNQFHGAVFEFVRNDNLDARNFFSPGALPEFRRNQFGGAIGGPVIKDKTFFFANYEMLRELQGVSSSSNVPSLNARQGILSSGKITVDPAIQKVLELYPLPNGPTLGAGDAAVFYSAPNLIAESDFMVTRGDHTFSDKARINGSYTYEKTSRSQPDALLIDKVLSPSRRHFANAEFTYVATPRLVNSARFGFNRSDLASNLFVPINNKVTDPSLNSIPGHGTSDISVVGIAGMPGTTGYDGYERYNFKSYQAYDNLSASFNRHSLRLGVSAEIIHDDVISNQSESGDFSFSSLRDFLLNKPDTFAAQLPGSDAYRRFQQKIWGVYVQDDYKIGPKLLLNLGLRYEFASDPSEADGKMASLRSLTDTTTTVGSFFQSSKRNFAPRVGLAWDPSGTGRTSIRGGFGIFNDLPLVNYLTIAGLRVPPYYRRAQVTGLSIGDYPKKGYDALVGKGVAAYDADSVEYVGRPAYRMQYNLSVQHEVVRNMVITAAYVGGGGRHLARIGEDYNLATPTVVNGRMFWPAGLKKNIDTPNKVFGRIRFWTWDSNSFYNSFQLGVNRRWQGGLQLQGAYTLSKSIDDGSSTFTENHYPNSVGHPYPARRDLGRGPSDFDMRQTLRINGTWDLPLKVAGAPGKLLNGWQLGGIFTATAGQPFSVSMGGESARTLNSRRGRANGERPDQATGTNNPIIGKVEQWFDPKAFKFPGAGFLGNLGRGTLIGPALQSLDFALVKDTAVPSISESFHIQFRVEIFNALNHANFQFPSGNQVVFNADGTFVDGVGRITRTVITNRQMQFGLKISF